MLAFGIALASMAGGCGDVRSEFLSNRVQDTCDGSWPVCETVAGCVLGNQSYREGRFPGRTQFIVRVAEPSVVRVSFLLDEVSAAGEQTVITFHEDGCRARIREEISGRAFVGDAERQGQVSREATLHGVGDHLIQLESDAQARYLVKVDVEPTRPGAR